MAALTYIMASGFAAAAAIWHSLAGSVPARAGNVALALALMALLVYNQKHPLLDIRHAKGQAIANEIFHQWNSFSRVAITQQSNGDRAIVIDGDAATAIANVDLRRILERDAAEGIDIAARGEDGRRSVLVVVVT